MLTVTINKIKQQLHIRKRVVIYLACGVASVLIDYSTFLVTYYVLRVPVALAVPMGLTAGLVASFALNRVFTFQDQISVGFRSMLKQGGLYMVLFAVNNFFTIYTIKLLLMFGVSAAIGKLFATIVITLWNYVLYKRVVFK